MNIEIVVPTFNREFLLGATIAGVQQQTAADWGLLIVDDGSTDDTRLVAQRHADEDRRIRVVTQANLGIAAARNLGIRNIRPDAEFVMFLDDDDVLHPRALELLLAALTADNDATAAYGIARPIDLGGRETQQDALLSRQVDRSGIRNGRLVRWPELAPTTFDVLAFANVIMTPGCVLIRRTALDRAGLFRDPQADWYMWIRLAMQGHLRFIPETVIGYRLHPGNVSANILLSSRRKLTVHSRMLWSAELNAAQRRTVWLSFLYYYFNAARLRRTLGRLVARVAYKRVGSA